MESNIFVIYHADCPDGTAAAYAASTVLGEAATYIPMGYSDKLPEIPDNAILYLVDFSFKRPVLLDLAARLYQIIILDHHKTAQEDLVDLPENVLVRFDMDRSGAQIAWAFFNPTKPEPKVISHIADRDLWKFQIPKTREITEAVMSYDNDLEVYAALIEEPLMYASLIRQGEALLRFKNKQISILAQEARAAAFYVRDDFYAVVPVVNAPYFVSSDLANHLLGLYPDAPFAACYRDAGTGRRDWSLRSETNRTDVSVVAKNNGGGGHRNAAGMSEGAADEKVNVLNMTWAEYTERYRPVKSADATGTP